MGRIARSVAMALVRGCLVRGLVTVYVLAVFVACFLIPLGRMSRTPGSDPKEIFLPFGIGTFYLMVLPALVAYFAARPRNGRFDVMFGSLGLSGFPYAFQYRRYDGTYSGRRLQAFFSRGLRLALEAETAVSTRLGVTAGSGDTRLLAGLAGEKPIRFSIPVFDGLDVYGKEEAWARRFLAEPGVPALLGRILRFEGPFARRQLVLRPGALNVTFHLSTAFMSWIPSAEQTKDRADALGALARIAERVPPPNVPIAPTRLERQLGKLDLSPAPGESKAVLGLATPREADGARFPVRVRVRFEGKAGGPITRIAAYRKGPAEPPAPTSSSLLPQCPSSFGDAGGMAVGESRSCVCTDMTGLSIFGTGRYSPSSDLCVAARHAGVLTRPGDAVAFWRQPDCPRLWGSAANGVVSKNEVSPTATYSFTAEPPPLPASAEHVRGPDALPDALQQGARGDARRVQLRLHLRVRPVRQGLSLGDARLCHRLERLRRGPASGRGRPAGEHGHRLPRRPVRPVLGFEVVREGVEEPEDTGAKHRVPAALPRLPWLDGPVVTG